MKVFFATTADHRGKTAVLDRRGVRRRFVSYADTAQHKKLEAERQAKGRVLGATKSYRDGFTKISWL
jgi:hypothetical protein